MFSSFLRVRHQRPSDVQPPWGGSPRPQPPCPPGVCPPRPPVQHDHSSSGCAGRGAGDGSRPAGAWPEASLLRLAAQWGRRSHAPPGRAEDAPGPQDEPAAPVSWRQRPAPSSPAATNLRSDPLCSPSAIGVSTSAPTYLASSCTWLLGKSKLKYHYKILKIIFLVMKLARSIQPCLNIVGSERLEEKRKTKSWVNNCDNKFIIHHVDVCFSFCSLCSCNLVECFLAQSHNLAKIFDLILVNEKSFVFERLCIPIQQHEANGGYYHLFSPKDIVKKHLPVADIKCAVCAFGLLAPDIVCLVYRAFYITSIYPFFPSKTISRYAG